MKPHHRIVKAFETLHIDYKAKDFDMEVAKNVVKAHGDNDRLNTFVREEYKLVH